MPEDVHHLLVARRISAGRHQGLSRFCTRWQMQDWPAGAGIWGVMGRAVPVAESGPQGRWLWLHHLMTRGQHALAHPSITLSTQFAGLRFSCARAAVQQARTPELQVRGPTVRARAHAPSPLPPTSPDAKRLTAPPHVRCKLSDVQHLVAIDVQGIKNFGAHQLEHGLIAHDNLERFKGLLRCHRGLCGSEAYSRPSSRPQGGRNGQRRVTEQAGHTRSDLCASLAPRPSAASAAYSILYTVGQANPKA